MRIGDLRNLVTIQQLAGGQDGLGQPVQTWTDLAQVYADIRYVNGMEMVKANAQNAVTRASIRIRFRSDVTTQMRVVQGAKVFQINAVLPDDTGKRYCDLACEVIS